MFWGNWKSNKVPIEKKRTSRYIKQDKGLPSRALFLFF